MNLEHPLVIKAHAFAAGAHGAVNQKRKYTGDDYIVHPSCVVARLKVHGYRDPDVLAAAWTHDVLEDTQCTYDQLMHCLSKRAADLVLWLTKSTTPAFGNRAKRHAVEVERLHRAPADAQNIKIADLMDNTKSIVEHDPKFAVVYLAEKEQLLDALTNASPRLLSAAREQLAHCFKELEG